MCSEMDTLSPPKHKVTLMGFSPKMEARSVHKPTDGISITVNGVPLSPHAESNVATEKIKLVGFTKNDSFKASPAEHQRWNEKIAETMAAEHRKRQERIAKLTEETREWFNKMNRQKDSWPEDSFPSASDKMQQFFDEAREKFAKCSQDLFDQFVQENQDRFAQMRETFDATRNCNSHENTSCPRPSDFNVPNRFTSEVSFQPQSNRTSTATRDSSFSSQRTSTTTTRDSGIHSSHMSSPQSPSSPRTNSSFSSPSSGRACEETNSEASSEFPTFKSTYNCDRNSAAGEQKFTDFAKEIPTFPRFPSFPIFPPPMMNGNHKLSFPSRSSGSYQMNASKSSFEYCGNTNTYRFSTEQMSQSYNHSCDTISESEDEEEEEESSTTGEPSECDDMSTTEDVQSESSVPFGTELDSKQDKTNSFLYKIANEILTTERSYVEILHLIDQIFQFRVDNENRAHNMFPQEVITQIFANIKSIYKLHHDFLLPQLELRMNSWEKDRRIGDIMKNFAPFLKMYTEYVKNFDNAMNTINFWSSKQPKFNHILEEIQKLPECGKLTLQHHMLSPIQRVPRYELLLKDYLKKLPEDSPDRIDSEKALHLVSTAANHSNEAMKKIDKFKKLLEIQDMIGGAIDLISPTRELMKEGKIIKISARSGDHQERYIFLFTDILLLCSQRLISNRVVLGGSYRVRARLQVDGLEILEGDNLETANTFYLRNNQKTIELYTQTPDEKEQWIQALCRVIQELLKKKSSLKIGSEPHIIPDTDLGKRPPVLLKMDNVMSCMGCNSQFTAFKRRHHCRACGQVLCHKCSPHKIPLLYDDNKPNRVCNVCYNMLEAQCSLSPENEEADRENIESPIQRKGVLEVKATNDSVLSGYLLLKTRGKTWVKRWFALHRDFVLYSFKGSEDDQAMTSTPIPGLTVARVDKSDNIDREHVFKLFHKKKVYYFQAQSDLILERWMNCLEKASKAEPPS